MKCIRKFAVSMLACFSTDVHIQLEEKIADFLKLEETALYSYGFAAVSSAIPSYAKAGDIIFACVSFSILDIHTSNIVYH